MEANVLKRGLVDMLRGGIEPFWRLVRDTGGARSPRPVLTASEFQEELAILGLSGRRFDPKDYADTLGDYLNISIAIHVIPDEWYPELSRRLAISGHLGELRYSEQLTLAAIFVPGSLPPLVLTLTILHELGHLAAGDPLVELSEAASEDDEHAELATFTTLRSRKRRS